MRYTFVACILCLVLFLAAACNRKAGTATIAPAPGNVQVTVQAGINKAGQPSTVRLHLVLDGKPLEGATVHGVMNMTNMDMGNKDVDFTPRGGGNYESKINFEMGGPWKIDLTIKHAGQTANAAVNINVPE